MNQFIINRKGIMTCLNANYPELTADKKIIIINKIIDGCNNIIKNKTITEAFKIINTTISDMVADLKQGVDLWQSI